MTIPAQVGRASDLLIQPRDESVALRPANVGGAALGAPEGTPVLFSVLRCLLHQFYFRLASDSESRERFLRLRFLASAAFTRTFCPGFK
jgi:hypothetical protein